MAEKSESLWDKYNYDNTTIWPGGTSTFYTKKNAMYPVEMWDEMIEKTGTPVKFQTVRVRALQVSCGAKPTENAENVIITGCYTPFLAPTKSIGEAFKLCETLGIKYNLLPEENCCSAVLMLKAKPEDFAKTKEKVKRIIQKNVDLAKKMGAKNIYYYCNGCQSTRGFIDDPDVKVGFWLDMLTEPLKQVKKLKVKPAKVAYYRGCWKGKLIVDPNLKFNWDTYRSWLDRIEGLEVVDLPNNVCCQDDPQAIIKIIRDAKVDYTISPCNACRQKIEQTDNSLPAVMLHHLLQEAVTYNG